MFDIKNLFNKKPVYSNHSITIWKDKKTKSLRWLAGYSSNYIDDDFQPDILSKEAHIDYINKVNSGKLPYPVLELWHLDGTEIGVSDYLLYDEDAGIAMATGIIYPEKENIVKSIAKMDVELGTSHGMNYIVRNEKDKKVIDKYVTIEISILPLVAAANKMTSFYILNKEKNMMSDKQKEFLVEAGLTEDEIKTVEQRNKQIAEENSFRERKSVDNDVSAEQTETTEQKPEESVPAEDAEKADEAEVKADSVTDQFATVEQVKSTIEFLTGAIEQRFNDIAASIEGLKKSLADVAEQSKSLEKSINDKTLTPGTTIDQIIHKSFIEKSLVSSKPKELQKDDPLYNDAPTETQPAVEASGVRGVIGKIIGGKL